MGLRVTSNITSSSTLRTCLWTTDGRGGNTSKKVYRIRVSESSSTRDLAKWLLHRDGTLLQAERPLARRQTPSTDAFDMWRHCSSSLNIRATAKPPARPVLRKPFKHFTWNCNDVRGVSEPAPRVPPAALIKHSSTTGMFSEKDALTR